MKLVKYLGLYALVMMPFIQAKVRIVNDTHYPLKVTYYWYGGKGYFQTPIIGPDGKEHTDYSDGASCKYNYIVDALIEGRWERVYHARERNKNYIACGNRKITVYTRQQEDEYGTSEIFDIADKLTFF
jgi:hypothetical protein